LFVTDVNVKDDDERLDRAFDYATQNLSIKVEKVQLIHLILQNSRQS